ncbi:MAG: hypothetical protein E6J91_20605 [Deltaproteobacteria bacterium]|nr:MAG: hypothetical protein E6J91_20605 [Deltaproteobacteria bacterium]
MQLELELAAVEPEVDHAVLEHGGAWIVRLGALGRGARGVRRLDRRLTRRQQHREPLPHPVHRSTTADQIGVLRRVR